MMTGPVRIAAPTGQAKQPIGRTACPPGRTVLLSGAGTMGAAMDYIVLNALPIAAATVTGLVSGQLFRFATGRFGGVPAVANRALTPAGVIAIALAQAWLASILAGALILAPSEAGAWTMAIGSAVVIWIGFVVPATVVNHVHRGLSPASVAIDSVYWLVVMGAQAVVLKSIGLVPPNG